MLNIKQRYGKFRYSKIIKMLYPVGFLNSSLFVLFAIKLELSTKKI